MTISTVCVIDSILEFLPAGKIHRFMQCMPNGNQAIHSYIRAPR